MTDIAAPETMTPEAASPVAAAERPLVDPSSQAATDERQQRAIRRLAGDLHRLNHAVMQAVEAGVTVELVRASRHHCGDGNWGDLMVPVIVKR